MLLIAIKKYVLLKTLFLIINCQEYCKEVNTIVFFLQDILKKVQHLSPGALIVDSIQTVYLKGIMGSPGGIMQVGKSLFFIIRSGQSWCRNFPLL